MKTRLLLILLLLALPLTAGEMRKGGQIDETAAYAFSSTSNTYDGATYSLVTDVILTRDAAASLQLGSDANSATNQIVGAMDINAGQTDIAGANLTITGGQSTGTGAGGSVIIQTSPRAAGTGSAVNALATALTINDRLHVISGGSAPAVSSCGTAPSIVGTDTAGKVTMGTGTVTACTITFDKAWTNAPACMMSLDVTVAYKTFTVTTTTTTMVIGSGTNMASDRWSYICVGY